MEENTKNEIKDMYDGIKKTNIKCFICNKSDWQVLGDVVQYNEVKEESGTDTEIEQELCGVIKLRCNHCGLVIEYDSKYFYDEISKKALKKIMRDKGFF
jgi:hypothetical protein